MAYKLVWLVAVTVLGKPADAKTAAVSVNMTRWVDRNIRNSPVQCTLCTKNNVIKTDLLVTKEVHTIDPDNNTGHVVYPFVPTAIHDQGTGILTITGKYYANPFYGAGQSIKWIPYLPGIAFTYLDVDLVISPLAKICLTPCCPQVRNCTIVK